MSIADWLPTILLALVVTAGWLLREWIVNWVKRRVVFEFDKKLEVLRGEIRESEETLRADLRAREAEIATLRSSAMTALSNRQIALDKRKLEAIDQLWSAIISLNKARGISHIMSILNFVEVAEEAKKDDRMRCVLDIIGENFDFKTDLAGIDPSSSRPFVSPMAWALYVAMHVIIMTGVVRWQTARSGLGAKDFTNHRAVAEMIKRALPEYSKYIDDNGITNIHFLVDKLELRILEEFALIMNDPNVDRRNVEQAADIVRYASEISAEMRPDGTNLEAREVPSSGTPSSGE